MWKRIGSQSRAKFPTVAGPSNSQSPSFRDFAYGIPHSAEVIETREKKLQNDKEKVRTGESWCLFCNPIKRCQNRGLLKAHYLHKHDMSKFLHACTCVNYFTCNVEAININHACSEGLAGKKRKYQGTAEQEEDIKSQNVLRSHEPKSAFKLKKGLIEDDGADEESYGIFPSLRFGGDGPFPFVKFSPPRR